MVVIMAGAILSSGCATVIGAVTANYGARSGTGEAMTFRKGPVYGSRTGAADYDSLADRVRRRPSGAGPLGIATAPPVLEPRDIPLFEWRGLGLGVKGLPAADIRRLGLSRYAGSWAESGLGRSVADMSHAPSLIHTYVQLKIFPGGASGLWLY